MILLPRRAFTLLFLAPLLWGTVPPLAAADDTLPEGARACLGTSRFGHVSTVAAVFPLTDGTRLLTMTIDAHLHVWDIASGKKEFDIAATATPSSLSAMLSPDGKSVATVSQLERVLCIWNLANGKELQRFPPLPAEQAFRMATWSHDGKLLVSSHEDGVIRTWDAATGKGLRQLSLPPAIINPNGKAQLSTVFFMPDDKSLGVIDDRSVRVIDPDNGKELRWFGGHTASITGLGFAPDGKLMATVGGDRHARLGDVATGKTTAQLPLPVGGGRSLEFSGDGKLLAVGRRRRLRSHFRRRLREGGKAD